MTKTGRPKSRGAVRALNVMIDEGVKFALMRYCERTGRTQAWVTQQAIVDFINRAENQ